MYASVRRYRIAGSVEELMRRVQEGFVPIVRQTPGFVAYYAIDGGDGTVASVSIFQDRSGAEASNERAAAWVRANLAELLPHSPEITAGDVSIAETT
jgi:hypothetical protein